MRKLLWWLVLATAASHAALADDVQTYRCERYKSKCTGPNCYKLADKIQQLYATKKTLPVKQPEIATYVINAPDVTETLHIEPPPSDLPSTTATIADTVVNYHYATVSPELITIEDKNFNGQSKVQIKIYPATGFYAHYLLHTDGSMKDIPLGTPFETHFGWCEKIPANP